MTQNERRIAAYMNLHGLTRAQAVAKVKAAEARKAKPKAAKKSTRVSGRKGLSASAYVNRPSQHTEHKAPTKRLKARRKKALSAPQGYFPNPVFDYNFSIKTTPYKYRVYFTYPYKGWLDYDRTGSFIGHDSRLQKVFDEVGYWPKWVDDLNDAADRYLAANKALPVFKKNPLKPGIGKQTDGKYHVEYSSAETGPWKRVADFMQLGAAQDYAKALAKKNPSVWFQVVK